MSTLKVNAIRGTGASADAITVNATDGTCTVKATNNLSNRNLIINGAMQVAQRGTSSTSNGYQTVDRFSHYSGGGTTTWSVGTETSGTVWALGLRKYLRCTNTANSTAAASYREITYKIENQDLMDSGWNPASTSSKLTLSFWVRASVGQVYYGRIRWMGDSADSNYIFSTGTLSANTWTKITKTIPGKSGKTLNDGGSSADNLSIFQLNWSPFQGTDGTASGTAVDQWNTYAGASKYPDFTTTWGSTNGATFDITGVQLEVGDSASDFEHRSYGDELLRCQRYYETIYLSSYSVCGQAYQSNHAIATQWFRQQKRANPSVTLPSVGQGTGEITFVASDASWPSTHGSIAVGDATTQKFNYAASGYTGSFTAGNATLLHCNGTNTVAVDSEL